MPELDKLILEIEQQIDIQAPPATVFEIMLRRLGEQNIKMPLTLERFPGGRWYRDLGDGSGHLWGLVQVYKPPQLLEIQGPLFMSYPVAGHVQVRVSPTPGGSRVLLRHRAIGLIEPEHRENAVLGWREILNSMAADACPA
ncbi:MAG: SRPBCC domain-containing protein [Pirellulales bacterium]|nr:SRPBCC domain-containing protein [Pirellulales bacterium]